MAGYGKQREPIDLIIAKGKKHLTKSEIEQRKNSEVNVDELKNIKAPSYLSAKQKKEFTDIANKLLIIGIMSELDEDCLARYLIAKDNYLMFTKTLNNTMKKKASKENKDNIELQSILLEEINMTLINQDRAFKQCRQCASDLGLSIASRCRLIVPQPKEQPVDNKFAKFLVG